MNENETVRGEQSVPQPNESPVTDAAVSAPTPPAAADTGDSFGCGTLCSPRTVSFSFMVNSFL